MRLANLFALIAVAFQLNACGQGLTDHNLTEIKEDVRHLEEEIKNIKYEVDKIRVDMDTNELLAQKGVVNLTKDGMTHIDDTFLVSRLEIINHLSGVKVSGRIVNSSSLDYEMPEFELTILGKSNTFSIPKISAGNSTGFSVYIPEVEAKKVELGRFEYIQGTISYLIK